MLANYGENVLFDNQTMISEHLFVPVGCFLITAPPPTHTPQLTLSLVDVQAMLIACSVILEPCAPNSDETALGVEMGQWKLASGSAKAIILRLTNRE